MRVGIGVGLGGLHRGWVGASGTVSCGGVRCWLGAPCPLHAALITSVC